jgi:hypothetical protein
MQADKVDLFLMTNNQFFPPEQIMLIKERLEQLPEDRAVLLHSLNLKNPTTILLISIFLGEFGVDRFMLGDTGMGVGKLLTLGGCLVWWFVDLFFVMNRAREVNFNNLMLLLDQSTASPAGGYDSFQ